VRTVFSRLGIKLARKPGEHGTTGMKRMMKRRELLREIGDV